MLELIIGSAESFSEGSYHGCFSTEGGPNTLAGCQSADVRDPFLGLRLGCGSRLGRKLEHCCFLMFKQVS